MRASRLILLRQVHHLPVSPQYSFGAFIRRLVRLAAYAGRRTSR